MSKTALITGASRGIGAAVAIRLAEDGYDIWLNYRNNHTAAEKIRNQVESLGRSVLLLPFDVTDETAVAEALGDLLDETVPDVLVNNAGVNSDNVLPFMSNGEWDSVMDTTLKGFFYVTRMVVTKMIRKKRGRIINISSTSGQTGLPGQVNYSAAKAGLIGATKALAKEVARRGILVNAVAPGLVESDMTEELDLDSFLANIPLKRIGRPEEVAGVVSFLCSEDSAYITGQVLAVNGGLYI